MTRVKEIQNKNQTLIGLAVKCKLITADQAQKVLVQLIEYYQNSPDYSIISIFQKNSLLSREKIDFLFAVERHLRTKMLDKRFGELGVNNNFVNPKAIERALDIQNAHFQSSQKSKKIGDILQENKDITLANKTAILLTQNRIQDQFLEQAINDIAVSEIEKMTTNMRFGAIAIKKGMISIEQLNKALNIQKNRLKSGDKIYLGRIFQDFFNLTQEQVLHILKIQKEFEKNRLSLEKAVERYNSEIRTNKRLNQLFELSVSKDKMSAYIHRIKDSYEKIDINRIFNWLKLNGIQSGVCSKERIEAFWDNSEIGSKLKIAQGVPPTRSRDEIMEFFFDTDFSISNDTVQEEPQTAVIKGTLLARMTPHVLGEPGKTVLGHIIPPSHPKVFPLACGEGVVRKNLDFQADIDGNPILYKNRTLFVTPIVQSHPIKAHVGHIKTDTLKTYEYSNLKMEGNIDQAGAVTCHDLLISGNISGKVHATGQIKIKGCIGIENPGRSGGQTHVHANGDIHVSKTVSNARIVTSKGFLAPKSDAVSIDICAYRDILLKNVRSSPDHPSILQIGINSNIKIGLINEAIDEQTILLTKLQRQEALDDLTFKLQHKINVQNEYLDKQNTLNYLLKIYDDDLKHLEHLKQKIQIFEPPQTGNLSFVENQTSLNYIDEILVQIDSRSPKNQKNHVNQKLTEVTRLYRASVDEVEKFSIEHRVRSDFIMKKINKMKPEIDKVKDKIETLLTTKDYLLLNEEKSSTSVEPVIKVKNMVEKNTIIKGKNSSTVIQKSIFGVKLKETRDLDLPGNSYKIVIEGYYD